MSETQGVRINVSIPGSPVSAGGQVGSQFSTNWPTEWRRLDAVVASIDRVTSPNGAMIGGHNHVFLTSGNHSRFIRGEVTLIDATIDDGQMLIVEVSVMGYGDS